MKKVVRIMLVVAALSAFSATAAFAGGPPETTDGFICPVLGGNAGGGQGNSAPDKFVTISGGDSTIIGPNVSVPVHSTNDDGAGSPGGDHASPGDDGYTAIWAN